jgi:hypothetical protein
MNPKFIELVEKADFALWGDEDWRPRDAFVDWSSNYDRELEKFYELIVRECAGIIEDAVDHREPASTYVDKIKNHFGINNE